MRFAFDSFVHRQIACYSTHPLFVVLKELCNYGFFIYCKTWMIQGLREHRWSGNCVTSWTIENLRFYSRQEQEITFFSEICRPAMVPTWPLIQWVPGKISLRTQQLEPEPDHPRLSSAEFKNKVHSYSNETYDSVTGTATTESMWTYSPLLSIH